MASSTITVRIAGVNKFYTANDIILNWRKINSYQGEKEKIAEDRPYTHNELKRLTEHTSLRNRAIILLMASSGPRVGAVPGVRIRDLEPIDQHNIYKITYYPKSTTDRYFSFCTPECRREIDNYLDFRKRYGERLTDTTPLFRRDYDPNTDSQIPRPIKANTINIFMKALVRKTGIRLPPTEATKNKRKEIMLTHGLRKFFKTNAFRAGMDIEYSRRLMGQHGQGFVLEDAYNKISEEDLLNGDSKHTGYIGIIDQLTINEENRLRHEVEMLKVDKGSYEELKSEIEQIRQLLKS